MGWLTDLLKEYPALSVAKERLALFEDRLRIFEAENQELKAENARLKQELSAHQTSSNFIEHTGVLWKQFNGEVEPLPYCPECKLAMSAFPPKSDEMLTCSKCNFTAPFPPSQVDTLAKKLEVDLLTA